MNLKEVNNADKYSILEYNIIYTKLKCNLQLYWYQDSFLVTKKKMFEKVVESLNLKIQDNETVKIHDKFYSLEWINYIEDVVLRQTFNNFRFKLSKMLISYQIKDMYEDMEDSDDDEPGETSTALELYVPVESQALIKVQERQIIKLEQDNCRHVDKINWFKNTLEMFNRNVETVVAEIERIKAEIKDNIENSKSRVIDATYNILGSLSDNKPNTINILAYCNSKLVHVYYIIDIDDIVEDIVVDDKKTGKKKAAKRKPKKEVYKEAEVHDDYDILEYHFNSEPYTQPRYQYKTSLWMVDAKKHLEYIKSKIYASNNQPDESNPTKPVEKRPLASLDQIMEWYEEYLTIKYGEFVTDVAASVFTVKDCVDDLKHNLEDIDRAHTEFGNNMSQL